MRTSLKAALVSLVAGAPLAIATPAMPSEPVTYVAIGDSFTAAPLVPHTDYANGCFRSDGNYPHLFAAAHPEMVLSDVSCSGATTADVTSNQSAGGSQLPPQLEAVTADTDLVTVSIGGNDEAVFATMVTECAEVRDADPTGHPCRTAMRMPDGTDRLRSAVRRTRERVLAVVRAVKAQAPTARVVVIGYPRMVPYRGTCAALPLARGDYRYARQVNRDLTLALRYAARRTGSTYLDLWRASAGHDICSSAPWVNGKDTDLNEAYQYHPFAAEQRAIARLLTRKLG